MDEVIKEFAKRLKANLDLWEKYRDEIGFELGFIDGAIATYTHVLKELGAVFIYSDRTCKLKRIMFNEKEYQITED